MKKGSTLHFLEQWQKYKIPNRWKLVAIESQRFLFGTRELVDFEEIGSYFLNSGFWRYSRNHLEDFVNCASSNVATRSAIGQGLSCCLPPILIRGDQHAPRRLFGMLLYGLFEKSWVKFSEMEDCIAANRAFVQTQRLRERFSTRGDPVVETVLSFSSSVAGFRYRCQVYKICIVCNHVGYGVIVTVNSLVPCSWSSNW